MTIEKGSLGGVIEGGFDYAGRLAAKGVPGLTVARDKRSHVNDIPCPDDVPRYLSHDARMWLVLNPPFDQRKINDILAAAFPKAYGRK